MIKIIFSDMDGTLLDENGEVPKEFPSMIQELNQRGILFAPASGRQYNSLINTFSAYRDTFLFVAENGTVVRHKGEELYASVMDPALTRSVLQVGAGLSKGYSVYCGKHTAYIRRESDTEEFREELRNYYTEAAVVDSFEEIEDAPIKASFYDPEGRAAESLYPALSQFKDRLQVVLSSDYWVDVMNPGANKGTAVQILQEKLGIKPEECAAFGDYLNDVEMLQSVYYSFAMKNAHEEIQKLARFSTESNAEHGVIKGIYRLLDGAV